MDAVAHTAEHGHPTPSIYVRVGVTLFVLTALEVALYEVGRRGQPPALAAVIAPVFVELLLLLSAFKFALVAMFYMHLKQDSRLFSGVFVFPLIIAMLIVMALLLLFGYLYLLHPLPK
jgi:heme/copper-type cytochrome/quinol oxidase subunit 4